ncbi:MAG TPA: PEGA domain-containing protein, partial [Kofleriaceae bacterium]
MDPREAYQATVPQHAIVPPPPQVPRPPPSGPRTTLAIVAGVVLILGIAIGVAIGHATSGGSPAPAVAAADLGHLAVTSKPVDANVLVDGRFSGVAPLERLDLDPGKHSVVIDAFGYQPHSGT